MNDASHQVSVTFTDQEILFEVFQDGHKGSHLLK